MKSFRQITKKIMPFLFPLIRLDYIFNFQSYLTTHAACYGSYEILIDILVIYLSCLVMY